jgi:hypothetical protein
VLGSFRARPLLIGACIAHVSVHGCIAAIPCAAGRKACRLSREVLLCASASGATRFCVRFSWHVGSVTCSLGRMQSCSEILHTKARFVGDEIHSHGSTQDSRQESGKLRKVGKGGLTGRKDRDAGPGLELLAVSRSPS